MRGNCRVKSRVTAHGAAELWVTPGGHVLRQPCKIVPGARLDHLERRRPADRRSSRGRSWRHAYSGDVEKRRSPRQVRGRVVCVTCIAESGAKRSFSPGCSGPAGRPRDMARTRRPACGRRVQGSLGGSNRRRQPGHGSGQREVHLDGTGIQSLDVAAADVPAVQGTARTATATWPRLTSRRSAVRARNRPSTKTLEPAIFVGRSMDVTRRIMQLRRPLKRCGGCGTRAWGA